MDIQQATAAINKGLEGLDWEREPKELYEPISYLISIGGKRIRPLLALFGCYLSSGKYEAAIQPSLAVEVFHNFTLMHDDIMDDAPLRRNQPTVHERWNSNIAIISGDAMMIEAYQLLLSVPPKYLATVMQLFNRCALDVCEGQQFDMNFEEREVVSKPEYLEMIKLKTAVLLGFSLQMGAIIGGANKEQSKLLYDFGVNIGLGFQLKDDLLDVYGDPATFGKQVGGDIIANKKTYLLIHALEVAQGEQARVLEHWLTEKTFDPAEKVKAVREVFDYLGVKEVAETTMNYHFDKGFWALDELEMPEERKEHLKAFAQWLINRNK